MNILDESFDLLQLESQNGNIYKVIDKLLPDGIDYLCKIKGKNAKQVYCLRLAETQTEMKQLRIEYNILKQAQQKYIGFQRILDFGQKSNSFYITNLKGPLLSDLIKLVKIRKFSLKTCLMIMDQLIELIQKLHHLGYIHRYIRPDSYCIGTEKNSNQIYYNNLQHCIKYISTQNKKHIPYSENQLQSKKNQMFSSINAILGIEQTRRDDLESILIMIIFFYKGNLPWAQNLISKSEEAITRGINLKIQIPIEVICKGMPDEFSQILSYIRNLEYEDKPNYNQIRGIVRSLFINKQFVWDFDFDWCLQNNIEKVALFKKKKYQGMGPRINFEFKEVDIDYKLHIEEFNPEKLFLDDFMAKNQNQSHYPNQQYQSHKKVMTQYNTMGDMVSRVLNKLESNLNVTSNMANCIYIFEDVVLNQTQIRGMNIRYQRQTYLIKSLQNFNDLQEYSMEIVYELEKMEFQFLILKEIQEKILDKIQDSKDILYALCLYENSQNYVGYAVGFKFKTFEKLIKQLLLDFNTKIVQQELLLEITNSIKILQLIENPLIIQLVYISKGFRKLQLSQYGIIHLVNQALKKGHENIYIIIINNKMQQIVRRLGFYHDFRINLYENHELRKYFLNKVTIDFYKLDLDNFEENHLKEKSQQNNNFHDYIIKFEYKIKNKVIIGCEAPDFEAIAVQSDQFYDIRLSDFRGLANILLVFYKSNFSKKTQDELLAFKDYDMQFQKLDTQIFAISIDSKYSNLNFYQLDINLRGLYGIKFPLISDSSLQIHRNYQIIDNQMSDINTTIYIDKQGIIQYMDQYSFGVCRNPRLYFNMIKETQLQKYENRTENMGKSENPFDSLKRSEEPVTNLLESIDF